MVCVGLHILLWVRGVCERLLAATSYTGMFQSLPVASCNVVVASNPFSPALKLLSDHVCCENHHLDTSP